MEQNLSLYEDKLIFYLVCSKDSEFSTHMQFAYEKLTDNVCTGNIRKVSPAECIELSGNFTKKHIVVFDEFRGECFEVIKNTQAIVLGPRSVISCLMDNVTLPDIPSPMFNLSMRDLIICLSSFDAKEKAELRTLIGYMGGLCIDQLVECGTHLVTESVRTKKYETAVLKKMKIMKAAWVHDVWKTSSEENVLATSKQFDCHKVPIFYKLRVTTTGISKREKKEVEEAVKNGGGSYFGEFSTGTIDVVIAKRNTEETAKVRAALNARKDCLSIEWIQDSVKQGCALPIESYRINLHAKKHTSTPEKSSNGSQFNNTRASGFDVSNIQFTATINETAMSNLSISSDLSITRKRKSNEMADENKDLSYKAAFEKLNVPEAKKAGSFLDGCNIFMCGFTSEEKEKISKIVNAGGATRYDTINSNLSHILVGNPSKKDLAMLQVVKSDAHLVKLDWLVQCIARKTAVDCDPYIYHFNGSGKANAMSDDQSTAPSPASKRNILLMSGQASKQATPKRLNFNDNNSSIGSKNESPQDRAQSDKEDELIDQYLKAPPPPPAAPAAPEPVAGPSKLPEDVFKKPTVQAAAVQPVQVSQAGSESEGFDSEYDYSLNEVTFLSNKKVHIRGFDAESHESLVDDCKIAGAEVIEDDNYDGIVDFLILPLDAVSMDGIHVKAKKVVNHNWLINAKRMHQMPGCKTVLAEPFIEIPYFYEPIFFPENLLPLSNMVIVFSLYSCDERSFLIQMATLLGADVKESFVRANKPLLICAEPKSSKYDAAIRWMLPVVSKNWLLECHRLQKRIPLRKYLVGAAIAPADDVQEEEEDDEEILCSQSTVLSDPKMPSEPSIPNRRVEQLRSAKPTTSPNSPLIPVFNEEVLLELDTPTRNSILQRFKELEEETPQTKRRRYEADGIKTPEEATTPYWMEFKRQQLEERRMRHAPTQEQIQRIQNRTPWSEVKRSLWKEALGDDYESPSQYYNANIQKNAVTAVGVDGTATRPSGRQLQFEQPDETEPDENIQMLADFINKGKRTNEEPDHYMDLPNTAPPESEIINSEQHEVIGWRDPSEVVDDTPKRNPKPKNTPVFSISCPDDIRNKIVQKIIALNGKVCENLQKYDSSCTHFVCERPSRSEKFLSCVAAGKWVLGLDYIHKSYEAKRFLNEEEYEWGNPKATTLAQVDGAEFGKPAYRWRKKQSVMLPSMKGIFKDFCIILKTSKSDSLRTLIEAGRGKVLDVDPNQPLDKQMTVLAEATHVLCQPNYVKFTSDEIKALEQSKVHVVTMGYLQAYITSETLPDVKKYLFLK